MEYPEISKTTFKNEYNIVEVLEAKTDIMEYLKTYKEDGKHAVAFGVRKTPRDTMPSWFKIWSKTFEARLDRIVKLNNLKE